MKWNHTKIPLVENNMRNQNAKLTNHKALPEKERAALEEDEGPSPKRKQIIILFIEQLQGCPWMKEIYPP